MTYPEPNFANRVTDYIPRYITPGEVFCRVFDHVGARTRGYGSLSWNPTVPDLDSGGRFDPFAGGPGREGRFGYIYFAQGEHGATVALWETLRQLATMSPRRKQLIIPGSEIGRRSLQYFEVSEHKTVVDVTTSIGRERYGAPTDVFTHLDRAYSKRWGRYFRANMPGASGFFDNSSRLGDEGRGSSIVLFDTRSAGLSFTPTEKPIPLDSPAGTRLVESAFSAHGIYIDW